MGARRRVVGSRLDGDASSHRTRKIDRLASLGTLAAGLGHDIGNVILPMRGHIHCLAESESDPARLRHIEALSQALNYLLQIADNLRLFAMDPDDVTASPGITDLRAWWHDADTLLREAVPAHIQLRVDLDAGVPALAVPAHRLTQAVLNLLLNSSEAMPGGGTVRLWTRYEQQRRLCVVGVSDDGPGMTARQKRHAFDPFFTSKHRRHATGLGLSLVHGVARSAGGFAEIETELGHGTTVTMHLPVATRIAAVKRRAALVTVDDQRVQACFESLLHASGFNLVTEADAEPLSLLVTDGSEPEATVRSRLQQHPGCRVIVFGDSECVVGDQVRRVTREGGLSAIRDAVTQAMTSGND